MTASVIWWAQPLYEVQHECAAPAVFPILDAVLYLLQARRRRKEALARALQATYERLQLYAHGARSGAWDEPTQQALQRHLVRGLGAEAVDQLLLYQQVRHATCSGIPSTQLFFMLTWTPCMSTWCFCRS